MNCQLYKKEKKKNSVKLNVWYKNAGYDISYLIVKSNPNSRLERIKDIIYITERSTKRCLKTLYYKRVIFWEKYRF